MNLGAQNFVKTISNIVAKGVYNKPMNLRSNIF